MADTSNVHKFIDKTISVANTAEQKFTSRLQCQFWAVQNQSAADSLFIKTNTDNDTLNAIEVLPGAYKVIGPILNSPNGYDLSDYRFVSPLTAAHRFTIEYVKG